jgi:hypothetical protein
LSAVNGRIDSAIVSYHKKSGATIRAKLGLLGHSAVGQGSARRTGWRTVKKGDSTGKQWKDVRVVGWFGCSGQVLDSGVTGTAKP